VAFDARLGVCECSGFALVEERSAAAAAAAGFLAAAESPIYMYIRINGQHTFM